MSLPGIVYPAAGLLPTVDSANTTSPYYAPASGGGGGGVGPTPSFSTITFPAAVPTPSGPTAGGILFSQQLLLDDLATQIAGDFAFTAAQPYPNGLGGATSTTSLSIFAPQNGCVLTVGCGEDEVIYIDGSAGGGDPAVVVRGVAGISVSSMTISSINGQVPGGGGGGGNGQISVSSITSFPGQTYPGPSTILVAPGTGGNLAVSGYPTTTNATGDIILDTGISANALATNFQPGGNANAVLVKATGLGGTQLNMAGTDAGGALIAAVNSSGNSSTLTVCSDNVKFLQPTAGAGSPLNIQAVDTSLYSIGVPSNGSIEIGLVGGRKQMYASVGEVDDLMVSSIQAVAGAKIQMTDPLVVGTIDGVNTINGAPPAVATTRTTVNTWSSGDIPGDGTNTAITPGFTTIAGHLYTLQGFLYANASANITSNASLALQIGNIDRAYQAAIPLWGYSAGTAGLVFGNNIPVNMTWRANTGAVNNAVYGQMLDAGGAATSTSITAQSALTLFDLGPVA